MISFLIPIYNRDVRKLVRAIYEQAEAAGIAFEILCYDDLSQASFREKNKELAGLFGVSYMDLSKNLGRSKIRNWLGKNARFEHLVFLDCDQYVTSDDFVTNYVAAIGQADVVYGGTAYQKEAPEINKRLHWKYGKQVEAQSVKKRSKQAYRSFRSNNFMIARSVFLQHLFDESIVKYGYEDSLIGDALQHNGRTIIHIDNPVIHAGLENNEIFLQKTNAAIENLHKLHINQGFQTRLTEQYERLDYWNFLAVFDWLDKRIGAKIDAKLLGEDPSIFAFQWYKLRYFHALMQGSKH